MSDQQILPNASAVAIGTRALAVEGNPGSGKSSLALALIDRGAKLIGDDGVQLIRQDGRIIVAPPPNIAGMLEIRGVGIVDLPTVSAPLALFLTIADDAPRHPDLLAQRRIMGIDIPVLPFKTGDAIQALRAEWALTQHGLRESA